MPIFDHAQLKIPDQLLTIWLAENILAHISGTKMFPNVGFVQEHNK